MFSKASFTCVVGGARPILNVSLQLSQDLPGSVTGGRRLGAAYRADDLQRTQKTQDKCPSEASFEAATTSGLF